MSSTMRGSVSGAVAPLESNFWSMWSQFGRAAGCHVRDEHGILWFETPIPVPPYNMVIRCHAGAEVDRAIEGIFGHFRARRVPFLWMVHPSARPDDLGNRLEAQGFAEVERVTGMVAGLGDLPPIPAAPEGIQIREVTPELELTSFLEFVATRWHVPESARSHLRSIADVFRIGVTGSPNRAWVALRGSSAVAKVVTHDHGGYVGLYGMATKPEARGQGLGRLMCLTALADARRRGHTTAVLHSTPMAVPLYRGVGFSDAVTFRLYAEPDSFYA